MAGSKVCLIIIDGWGLCDERKGNAILNAKTPVMDKLEEDKERCVTLDASGLSVGLPRGLMGNSEVGHLNIGAGRIVYQDITRINLDMENGRLGNNGEFVKACLRAKENGGRLHLLGLVSDGGVHSHIDHIVALLAGAKAAFVPKTYIQFFGDGRDTAPTSGAGYLKKLLEEMKKLEYGEVASVTGRYYAMDRDKRWERIKVAYEGLVKGTGEYVDNQEDLIKVMEHRYQLPDPERQTDEFFTPILVKGLGRIHDNDTVVFCNYRSDRMREIVEAFGVKPNFETDVIPKNLHITCMTQYNEKWTFPLLYAPQNTHNTISEYISQQKLRQFHCAETEKYAHVTFFFNGGKEISVENEERCLVASPKVATYNLQPEMSAAQVTDRMIEAIQSKNYQFVMCNFAPPDMVGHTGVYDAAVIACQVTDLSIGRIEEACKQNDTVMLVTSDHGNAEQMLSPEGKPHTAHTTNRVPFYMSNSQRKFAVPPNYNAAICDVAPTVLDLMEIGKPVEMTGISLLAPI